MGIRCDSPSTRQDPGVNASGWTLLRGVIRALMLHFKELAARYAHWAFSQRLVYSPKWPIMVHSIFYLKKGAGVKVYNLIIGRKMCANKNFGDGHFGFHNHWPNENSLLWKFPLTKILFHNSRRVSECQNEGIKCQKGFRSNIKTNSFVMGCLCHLQWYSVSLILSGTRHKRL